MKQYLNFSNKIIAILIFANAVRQESAAQISLDFIGISVASSRGTKAVMMLRQAAH
jgi:hypothetical protein